MALNDQNTKPIDLQVIWSCSSDIEKYKSYFSSPQLIEFPTEIAGQNAYAYFYPPCNPHYKAGQEEKPPLLLESHGTLSKNSLIELIAFFAFPVVINLLGYPISFTMCCLLCFFLSIITVMFDKEKKNVLQC